MKSTVVRLDRIDWVVKSKLMIDLITKLNRGETIDVPIGSGINGGSTYPFVTPGFGGSLYRFT